MELKMPAKDMNSMKLQSHIDLLTTENEKLRREKSELERSLLAGKIQQSVKLEGLGHRNDSFFHVALQDTNIGVWDFHVKSGDLIFNNSFPLMFGYNQGDFENSLEWCKQLIHPDDFENIYDDVFSTITPESPSFEGELRVKKKSGEWLWILDRGKVVEWDIDDKPIRMVGTIIDISKRKEAEARVSREKDRLEEILDCMPVMVDALDDQFRVSIWNRECERVTGYKKEEVIGELVTDFFAKLYPDDDYRNELYKSWETIGNDYKKFEVQITAKSGDVRTVAWDNVSLDFKIEGITSWAIGQDITEVLKADEERKLYEEKLRVTQKLESLGVLAGGIAHDFNNLLVGILGNANLALLDISKDSPAFESIKGVETAAERAAELTQQMLTFSGGGRLKMTSLNISDLVVKTSELVGASISKKAIFRFSFDKNLPNVMGDASQLDQVLMNLMINASESLEGMDGEIYVSTGYKNRDQLKQNALFDTEELSENGYVYIKVNDNGCGMTDEVQQKIFEPFFTTKFTGRGLGLAALLGIIKSHDGTISVKSEVGKGSCFTIYLPCSDVDQIEAKKETAPTSLEDTDRDVVVNKIVNSILIVDDEEIVREVAQNALEMGGYSVVTAPDGIKGLEIYKANVKSISAVLLDMTMPHMDGAEVFAELRKIRPDLPVIITSGYSKSTIKEKITEGSIAGYLRKPYRINELLEMFNGLAGNDWKF
jgi:two-component system, cell cycle sensor histidine kinase and response regulator CckA